MPFDSKSVLIKFNTDSQVKLGYHSN